MPELPAMTEFAANVQDEQKSTITAQNETDFGCVSFLILFSFYNKCLLPPSKGDYYYTLLQVVVKRKD